MTINAQPTGPVADRRGFILPAVLFALTVLMVVGLTAIETSGTERTASNALKQSMEAFYAAEAGATQVLANWDAASYDTISAGTALDLGWQ